MAEKTLAQLALRIRHTVEMSEEDLQKALDFHWDKPEITSEAVESFYLAATMGSKEELYWLAKWLELCEDTEDVMDVYATVCNGDHDKIVLQRAWELFQQEP